MSKFALAAITGALAILATPASAQNHGHSQGYGHRHAQHHSAYHRPVHHAYRQPSHHGHSGYAPTYHAPRYVPVVTTYQQPSHCAYVFKQHGYATQKVLVCNAPVHHVKHTEAPPVAVEAAPIEVEAAPIEAVPQK